MIQILFETYNKGQNNISNFKHGQKLKNTVVPVAEKYLIATIKY